MNTHRFNSHIRFFKNGTGALSRTVDTTLNITNCNNMTRPKHTITQKQTCTTTCMFLIIVITAPV